MGNGAKMIRNTGKPFEAHLLEIASIYENRGILSLVKSDPPVRVVGFGPARKVIFLRNPFVDFVGVWKERNGRAIFLEAKSTADPSLDLDHDNGITDTQIKSLKRWSNAGAAVGVLWECQGSVKFISLDSITRRLMANLRKIHFHQAEPVGQGEGFVMFDFIKNL